MEKTMKGWPTDSVRRVGHADVVAGVGVVNAVPHVRLQGRPVRRIHKPHEQRLYDV